MASTLSNEEGKPFLKLFKELYMAGMKFAIENPKYVEVTQHLLANRGPIFDELMKDNLEIAIQMYSQMIDIDKEKGLIRKDVDTKIFAKMVLDMTLNVVVDQVETHNEMDYDAMYHKVTTIIDIIEKGVSTGE